MGAYDNMFSNASTFKVELDEWYVSISVLRSNIALKPSHSCKILRDATPKSFVILDGEWSKDCRRLTLLKRIHRAWTRYINLREYLVCFLSIVR